MTPVSVIIVSYNTKELLQACLASVEAELSLEEGGGYVEAGHEIWVVDNASADGSAQMVERAFPAVQLIENDVNRGFSAANNQAMARSKGHYLLLLNPDTVLHRGAIGMLASFLDAHPEVGLVTGQLLNPDGSFQHSAFRFPGLWQIFLDFFPLHHRLLDSWLNGRYPQAAYRRPFAIEHPLGACMMVRRQAVEAVGPLSEDFFIYCEEIDWCFRLCRAGWQVYCVPQARITHYGGQSTRQFWGPMFVELHRSRLLLYQRHYAPSFVRMARHLVRLGIAAERLRAWWARRGGRIDEAAYRQRSEAYRRVLELLL